MAAPGDLKVSPDSHPLRNPQFVLLWVGQVVSGLGDAFFGIALLAVVVGRKDPAASVGVLFAVRLTASSLFIMIGGVFADRFDRIRLMVATDVWRFSSIAVLLAVGLDSPLWFLSVLAFLLGTGEAIFAPTYDSLLPFLVAEESRMQANSLTRMARSTIRIGGPALGGVLVGLIGSRATLGVDCATFVVSSATLLMIRRRVAVPRHASGQPLRLFAEASKGFQVLFELRWLGALQVMSLVHTLLAVAPWYVLLPIISRQRLGGIAAYGALLTSFFVGEIPGALAAPRLRSRVPGAWALFALMQFGTTLVALALTTNKPVLFAVFFVSGFGSQFFDVHKTTAIQEQVPRELLGRVFALDFLGSTVMLPLGALLVGLFVTQSNMRGVLLGAAALIFSTTMLPLLVPGVSTFGRIAPTEQAPVS